MAVIEVLEVFLLIIYSLCVVVFFLMAARNKIIRKYIPGVLCFLMVLISTNVEALAAGDFFNLMEHLFVLMTGLFMTGAIFLSFYNSVIKEQLKLQK